MARRRFAIAVIFLGAFVIAAALIDLRHQVVAGVGDHRSLSIDANCRH